MRVHRLVLKNFRNYETFDQTFDRQVIIFRGANAQGKTNVLEALYMLSIAKSHRTNRDRDCIRWGAPFAVMKATVERKSDRHRLEVQLSPKGKKVKRNGVEQRRLSDYLGTLNAVMFAPEDLSIVKGRPEMRRRFLDMSISQVTPTYVHHLSRYNKVLAQRNHLLKSMWQTKAASPLLDVLNEQLVTAGVHVLLKRVEFIRKIESWAQDIQAHITNGHERLQLSYRTFVDDIEQKDESALREEYYALLKSREAKERERGSTLIGPHRDDVTFTVNDIDVQTFGSQGQQRTTALSLKLAEIELVYEVIGEYPILLLDDVLSELDVTRQTHLIHSIRGKVQTFVTTTSTDGIDERTLRDASVYDVERGNVRCG